ncbi:MAG: L,D-transpeptidase family protein [Gammaproteobacteria bacterium]|nr:L,D-transpeptidase family protein [Gammaproteobacteria bacterium]
MLRTIFLACLMLIPLTAVADAAWVKVDTQQATVTVLKDGQTVLQLKNAAFGRGGVGMLHKQGDGRTPLGSYRIAWINHQSPFHVFFGLNYPTAHQALYGFVEGILDENALDKIREANASGEVPPQNTALGGQIGIHGLGQGSLWMHRHFNWTEGCVALTNKQIEKLAHWLEIGTRVVIQ